MSERWRALVADDEPLARELLRDLLAPHNDIELVGEAEDGAEAMRWLASSDVDLVFLDIRMPEKNGFDVLRGLPADRVPEVIFVTAFDRYAVRAFDVAAVDYLLKPYDQERLDIAVGRVRRRLQERDRRAARHLGQVFDQLEKREAFAQRLFLKSGERIVPVEAAAIRWLEADGKLVRVHAGRRTIEVRDSLVRFEREVLDPERFVRVSRSALVNLDRITEIQRWFHGELILLLDDGAQVPTTRRFRKRVEARIAG